VTAQRSFTSLLDLAAAEVPLGNPTLEFALGVLDSVQMLCAVLNGRGITTPEALRTDFNRRAELWQRKERAWRARPHEILSEAMVLQALALDRGEERTRN
jgi:hypothetical protein